jgi:hypothetical protein
MPPRRRSQLAAQDAELNAWRGTFTSGFDFLRALPAIGVSISKATQPTKRTKVADMKVGHRPQREVAEDAWRRLGHAYLAERAPDDPPSWAEREFGDPTDIAAKPRPSKRNTL